jgi:hypothetical protein
VIFEAVAEVAALRLRHVPPLTLLERDADKLRAELDQLLERAETIAGELARRSADPDPGAVDAARWLASAQLGALRHQITLAHCELIPTDSPRRAAAARTAAYFREKTPALRLLDGGQRAA